MFLALLSAVPVRIGRHLTSYGRGLDLISRDGTIPDPGGKTRSAAAEARRFNHHQSLHMRRNVGHPAVTASGRLVPAVNTLIPSMIVHTR